MGRRGFRRVPETIRSAIENLDTGAFRVAATRRLTVADLDQVGPLGIVVGAHGSIEAPEAVVPPASQGRWSRWNLHGRLVVRRDLPKVSKDFGWEAPNFGDSSKGTHWVAQTREVYQRELWYGQQIPILITLDDPPGPEVLAGFIVDLVLDRANYTDRDLVFALSLAQENVGSAGIVPAELSLRDWLHQHHVDWEFLPVGSWDRDLIQVLRKLRVDKDSATGRIVSERLQYMYALKPVGAIVGSSGFERYLGFKFRDDLVVFENIRHGNAAYIMYGDWQVLSKRSRTELFRLEGARYDRVVHRDGWQDRIRTYLRAAGHL